MNWVLLKNSLLVSGGTTMLAMVMGCMAALALTGLEARWRRVGLIAAILALAMPPFLVVNCWLHFIGHAGVWTTGRSLNLYSFGGLPGTVLILSLLTWPVSLFAVVTAWRKVEAGQLECDPALTGWKLIRWLLWPAARSAVAQAAVITFVLALNNFAVPALLQVKVFPAELWVRFSTTFDYSSALLLSWPMVLAPVLLWLWLRRKEVVWPRIKGPLSAAAFRRQLGQGWFNVSAGVTVLVVVLSLGLPLFQLTASARTWRELPGAWAAATGPMWNSFFFAAVTATVVIVLGLAGRRMRVGGWLWVPFLVPGVLLGVALIFLLNRPVLGVVYHSAAVVIIGLTIRYLAPGWLGVSHAVRSADPLLADAARLEGATGWQVFRHAQWPQIALPVGAAWYVVYLLCLWDVETLVLIVPPGGETVSLRVFNLLHYGHNAQVNALCLMLLLLAVGPLLGWIAWRAAGRWAGSVTGGNAFSVGHGLRRLCRSIVVEREGALVPLSPQRGEGSGVRGGPLQGSSTALLQHERSHPSPLIPLPVEGRGKSVWSGSWFSGCTRPSSAYGRSVRGALWISAGALTVAMFLLTGCGPVASSKSAPLDSAIFERVEIIGSRGTGVGEFNKPRSVAVDAEDNLYVVDMTGRVQKFSPDGEFLLLWQMEETDIGKPKGMCRDAEGNIIVIEPHYSRVNHFSPDGELVAQWGDQGIEEGQIRFPRAAAVNSKGEIWVSEYGAVERVQRFALEGGGGKAGPFAESNVNDPARSHPSPPTPLPVEGRGEPEMTHTARAGAVSSGTGILPVRRDEDRLEALSYPEGERKLKLSTSTTSSAVPNVATGDLDRVAGSRTVDADKFQSAQLLLAIGKAGDGPGDFNRPEGLGIDAEDRLYVADSCNHRIQVFAPDGTFLREFGRAGGDAGELSYPYDIRIGSEGLQYVCEFGNSRIQIFDSQDQPLEIIGHAGAKPGEFANPWSIALDSKGNLYVADSQNHRVQKLVRRGEARTPRAEIRKNADGRNPKWLDGVGSSSDFGIRISFGPRISEFGFSDLP